MKRIVSIVTVVGTLGFASHAFAALTDSGNTQAGTLVTNTAQAQFTVPGIVDPIVESSGPVSFRVDEILDVVVTGGVTRPVSSDTDAATNDTDRDVNQVVTFTVQNTGNGVELYNLVLGTTNVAPDFNVTDARMFIDLSGDGNLDPGEELTSIELQPDQVVTISVEADIPAALQSGDEAPVTLTAIADTKAADGDAAGTVYPGQGDTVDGNATDAIVGATTANQTASDLYVINQLIYSLTKVATKISGVGDLGIVNTGSVVQLPGDVVRYKLTFDVTGDGIVDDLKIVDAIPVGVDFIPGSIYVTYDGVARAQRTEDDDTDSAVKGAIPLGLPASPAVGVVVDVEKELGNIPGGVAVSTTGANTAFQFIVEFDVEIPGSVTTVAAPAAP